jgi:hypothetical protein
MRNHRLGTSGTSLKLAPRGPLRDERCFQCVDVIRKCTGRIAHADN